MGFDPYNYSLKIWDSMKTSTSQSGSSLGSMKCDSQASFLAHTFSSLCLGLKPKARVATPLLIGTKNKILISYNIKVNSGNVNPNI
jgi:hypothetical protein